MPKKTGKSVALAGLFLWLGFVVPGRAGSQSTLPSLLPKPGGWEQTEAPALYAPATLFEYIDGAAENYLSYGFMELAVGSYKEAKTGAALTVEIYDMGDDIKAFGIYSSEKYPESHFLAIGNQGYWEEGSLNFIVGRYYVKLLCFDCGVAAEEFLTSVAREIEQKAPDKGRIPPLLGLFSVEGLVPNSERFVLQNVLGYGFLHHGYMASCRAQDQEFELFAIQGKDARDAQSMLTKYLDSQREGGQAVQPTELGYHVRDRYSGNIYLVQSGNLILGVMKIKDGSEGLGLKYLRLLAQAAPK
jgi:Family of unknown function (DUF6599)